MQQAKTTIRYIPLTDRVLVIEDKQETKTPGGIIIPESAEKEPKATGVVVAVGAGFKDQPMTVQCGDKINFSKYAGSEIKIDGVMYKIMREPDVFGIFPDSIPTDPAVEAHGIPDGDHNDDMAEEVSPQQFAKRLDRKIKK